jgi:hypothetical protein
MIEHHTIMRDVIRTMDESGEPYVREASFVSKLHRYIQRQNKDKKKTFTYGLFYGQPTGCTHIGGQR